MATITLSGYLVTIQTVVWTTGQDLDNLTADEWTDLADEIDNSTNKYALVDLELALGSAAFTGLNVDLYLIPSIDGTTFGDWTGNVTSEETENQPHRVCSFTTSADTAAQLLPKLRVALPNGKYKWALRNKAGVTLAASGNSLKWRPHSLAI